MPNTLISLNIAIVEDDKILREELGHFLRSYGYVVQEVVSSTGLDDLAQESHIDILILDLNLPGPSGFEIAKRYRAQHPTLGIIVLSARTAGMDRIKSYEDGADIYIPKPCPPDELLAAIRSLARRVKTQDSSHHWQLDPIRHVLSCNDGSSLIELSSDETALICALGRAPEQQLTADYLCILLGDGINGDTWSDGVTRRALENKISRLRKKFANVVTDETSLIKSVRGEGYQLCIPIVIV
jgi:DNA-binding response OmpR family regulator